MRSFGKSGLLLVHLIPAQHGALKRLSQAYNNGFAQLSTIHFHRALCPPPLKKPSLDPVDLGNFIPVSSLPFLGEVIK